MPAMYLKQLPALQYLETDSSLPEKIRPLLIVSHDTVLKMLSYKPDKPSLAEIYGIIAVRKR